MGLWDRYIVPPLISCACNSKPIIRQRQKTVPQASGVVVELGCGAGTNFDIYEPDRVSELHAIEPSHGMMQRAAEKLDGHILEPKTVLHSVGAERLPLGNSSVDTAVVTFVLCTIPDWQRALEEIRRVLKPDGTVLFSEHALAPDPEVAKWQRRIEPVWKRIGGGCHLTRDTRHMLSETGFRIDQYESMYLPNTPKIAGFAVWGRARAI